MRHVSITHAKAAPTKQGSPPDLPGRALTRDPAKVLFDRRSVWYRPTSPKTRDPGKSAQRRGAKPFAVPHVSTGGTKKKTRFSPHENPQPFF